MAVEKVGSDFRPLHDGLADELKAPARANPKADLREQVTNILPKPGALFVEPGQTQALVFVVRTQPRPPSVQPVVESRRQAPELEGQDQGPGFRSVDRSLPRS